MDRHGFRTAGLLLIFITSTGMDVQADEGFFSPNTIPYSVIHATYPHTELTPEKVQRLMQATVKITNPRHPGQGGTGTFISPDGLVLTNHHVAETCLDDQRLTRFRPPSQAPFGQRFFYAQTLEQEIPCYTYHLEGTQKWRQVKLVYLPSAEIARLGSHLLRDITRHLQPLATAQADFAFLRAYDETTSQPSDTSQLYLSPNPQAEIQANDFVMTMSFPNNTQRHQSHLYLKHLYNVVLPLDIFYFSATENIFLDRIRRLESESETTRDNSTLKTLIRIHDDLFLTRLNQGLQRVLILSLNLIERQQSQDQLLASTLQQKPELHQRYGQLFASLEQSYNVLKDTYLSTFWLQKLLDTALLSKPYRLIRSHLPSTSPNPNPGINLEDLQLHKIFRSELDEVIHLLTGALITHLDERFEIPWIATLIRLIPNAHTLEPMALATQIVSGWVQQSQFFRSDTYRYELATADRSTLLRYADPLIQAVISLHQALQTAKQHQKNIERQLTSLHALYHEARQVVFSSSPFYGNADGSIRFSYGQIQGLSTIVQDYPFSLPALFSFETLKDLVVGGTPLTHRLKPDEQRFVQRAQQVFEDLPVNVLSTLDIAHGSSGSALINTDLEVMGTNFARNWAPQIHDATYHEAHRAVSVSLSFILAYLAAETSGELTATPPQNPPPNRLIQELQAAHNHGSIYTH